MGTSSSALLGEGLTPALRFCIVSVYNWAVAFHQESKDMAPPRIPVDLHVKAWDLTYSGMREFSDRRVECKVFPVPRSFPSQGVTRYVSTCRECNRMVPAGSRLCPSCDHVEVHIPRYESCRRLTVGEVSHVG